MVTLRLPGPGSLWLGRRFRFAVFWCLAIAFSYTNPLLADLTVPQKFAVIRVRVHDDPNSDSKLSQGKVQSFFNDSLNTLWSNVSYGTISIDATGTVSDLYTLDGNRSSFATTDDTFGNSQQLIDDALKQVKNNGQNIIFNGVRGIVVVVANTAYRGVTFGCNLPDSLNVLPALFLGRCAIVGDTPNSWEVTSDEAKNEQVTWGRWAHEMGHIMQQAAPPHPSNYISDFELMDRLYPGQSGMFEKQSNTGFPGWMPPNRYKVLCPVGGTPTCPVGGGDSVVIAAEEDAPNSLVEQYQAIRIEFSPDVYYLVSLRFPRNGDDLKPISGKGVLIERVVTQGDTRIDDASPDDQKNGKHTYRWVYALGGGAPFLPRIGVAVVNYLLRIHRPTLTLAIRIQMMASR
jgi:hypothetical protein